MDLNSKSEYRNSKFILRSSGLRSHYGGEGNTTENGQIQMSETQNLSEDGQDSKQRCQVAGVSRFGHLDLEFTL
jgi:hypothetical protein